MWFGPGRSLNPPVFMPTRAATLQTTRAVMLSTTVALPSLRVSTSVSDPPAVAAAHVYSGQSSLGVRAKVAAGINPQGNCNCSTYLGR